MANNSSNSSRTTAWFIVGFIVLVTAGAIIAGAMSSNSSSNGNSSSTANPNFVATVAPALTAADHVEGNASATVSLIEYGDFECPACAEYNPIVKQIVQNYGDKIAFSFRNFPLYTIHPFAGVSSQAAEAAGLEGGAAKYWAMNNLLYSKQNEWSTNSALTPAQVVSQYLDGYAQSIGLDVNTFNNDMNATSVAQKIQNDVTGGNTAQIDHTPTFFVNLVQIENPQSLADFEKILNAAVASSTQ